MLQLKREINQFKILIDKEQVRMNDTPSSRQIKSDTVRSQIVDIIFN